MYNQKYLIKRSFKKYVDFFYVTVKKLIVDANFLELLILIEQLKNFIYFFENMIHFFLILSELL
jgi:hypothetical protein